MSVLDACGVPRALAESADGTAAREGWRRFVMGSVEPLLAIVGARWPPSWKRPSRSTWAACGRTTYRAVPPHSKGLWPVACPSRKPWPRPAYSRRDDEPTPAPHLPCGRPTVTAYHDHCVACIRTAKPPLRDYLSSEP